MKPTWLIIAAVAAAVIGGCSGIHSVDLGYSLIDALRIDDVAPDSLVADQYVVTIAFHSRYAGRGHMAVCAYQGCEIVAPDPGDGRCVVEDLDLPVGTVRLPVVVRWTDHTRPLTLDANAACDSLALEGGFVDWQSPEGHSIYRNDLPPNTADVSNRLYIYATPIGAVRP